MNLKKLPNYVYGQLYVYGDKKRLQEFKEFAQGEQEYYDDMDGYKLKTNKEILDMNKFIKYPQEFKDIDVRNKEYNDWVKMICKKVEDGEKLTDEEQKKADEIALCELEGTHLEFRKDGYNSGGYEWCCNNWGTKWNFGETTFEESEDELHYIFKTAWSIPYPILFKMSEMFPDLEFNYLGDEESEEFEVDYHFKEGELREKEEKDWKSIQIEKIKEGNIDGFDYDMKLYDELKLHTGHDIECIEDRKFVCKTCENKLIWDCK
jgi:hypothetical protein